MKTYNHLFVSLDKFEDFLDSTGMDRDKKALVRIHSSIHTAETMQPLTADIQASLPNAVIIGCSTPKVICEGKIESGACLVSVTELENCDVRIGMFPLRTAEGEEKNGEALGKEVSEALVKGTKGLLLVFYPVSYYRTAGFVQSMNRLNEGLKMIGGAAYMDTELYSEAESKSYVLAGTKVSAESMAAVLLSSQGLSVYENVICGVENVGRSYEVTKVSGHCLDEIEGEDCAVWYAEQLGREELDKNPVMAGVFPLVDEEAPQIAYNVIYEPYDILPQPWKSEKKNRISLFTEIAAGKKFALGYFDPQKIVNQLNQVYQDLRKEPVEVLFAYDCLSRMWMLHDCAKWEISQFYTTNMSGAMLGGEISNVHGENIYANSTFVIAGLSENPQARLLLKGNRLKNVSALQHDNIQMINYLLKTGHNQLSRELSEQREKMEKAMFYDTGLGLDNQEKYLFDYNRLKLDKIAVFTLKNERIVRLFMGQKVFLQELKDVYRVVRENLIDKGLHLYSYGECSLLIAGEAYIDDALFVSGMKAVCEHLNGTGYGEFIFSYGCAVVMHEEDALQKAEEVLQYGIKNKIPFMTYGDLPVEVLNVKEEMHMLQILKEALVQDGIVPYFQGIYDNNRKKIGIYEALIRIRDKQGNMYYPNQILPVAKEYNLYEAMSDIMIRKVMEMFLDKDIKVSINLSVQDIYDRDILKSIFWYLKKASHPENYIFELVESEEVKDYQFIKQFADSIHEHGAKIAIDDFGSGFSNLLHIIRIDADIIKIDGEIIKEIEYDKNCREFVELLKVWCSKQGKELIAEFVENECIQNIIEEMGVSYSQGYYFAKPGPWEEADSKAGAQRK